jgi:hypothetical protein
VIGHPVDRVQHEVAFLGLHVHWTLHEVLGLDHGSRREWVRTVAERLDEQ